MAHGQPGKPWKLLTALLAALLACSGLGLLLGFPTTDRQLAAARQRWQLHGFSAYRLTVNEETESSSCRQSLEIQNERVRSVLLNECGRPASWTVPNLFTWTAQPGRFDSRCYPSGVTCVCYMVFSTQAIYNPDLGYPQRVTYQWRLIPNLAHPRHWQRLLLLGALPECQTVSRFAEGHITLSVTELSRIP